MKIVLDANVIIAAFASRGLCESVMEVCLSEHDIILYEELLTEVLRNLRLKIRLPEKIVDDIAHHLREHAKFYNPLPLASNVCRDSEDVKIIGVAIAANADYIVTGDKDLLVLKAFQGIPILNPRSFSNILHGDPK
jgi:putative PIN family toxin of toxin-antitoxin system